MTSWTEYLLERTETPPFLKKENTGKLTASMGYILDVNAEALQRCVTSGLPNHENLAADGMALRGRERGIPRRPGESLPSYAARIKDAWNMWQRAGSRAQLIEEIEGHLGITGVFIVAAYEWDGGTYPAWGDPDELLNWSRFWIYCPHTGHNFTADDVWDSPGTWDDGGVWDFANLTAQQVQNLRWVIDHYRPAHEIPVRFRFFLEAGTFTDVDEWSGDSISLEFYSS